MLERDLNPDERKASYCKKDGDMSLGHILNQGRIRTLSSDSLGLKSQIKGSPMKEAQSHNLDEELLPSHLENTRRREGDLRIPRARKWKRRARDQAEQSNAKGN
ncbi:hypothetical protein U1Q18_016447 [Sarracenia purpurea var. burkii]